MAEMGVPATAPAEEIQSAGVRAAQEAARAERNEQSRPGGQQRRRGGRNRRRGGQGKKKQDNT